MRGPVASFQIYYILKREKERDQVGKPKGGELKREEECLLSLQEGCSPMRTIASLRNALSRPPRSLTLSNHTRLYFVYQYISYVCVLIDVRMPVEYESPPPTPDTLHFYSLFFLFFPFLFHLIRVSRPLLFHVVS